MLLGDEEEDIDNVLPYYSDSFILNHFWESILCNDLIK